MSVVYSDIEHSYSDIEYEVTSDDGLSTDDEFTIPASYAAEAATSDTGEIALLYDHLATSYMDFTNACPTTFHTIEYFTEILEKNGFTKIHEKKIMSESMKEKISKGGFFYSIRSNQTLIAFVIGPNWVPTNGIGIIGSHVDALTVKLKPISLKSDKEGYKLLGVAPYSGSLNKLWLDRDLFVGGRVIYKSDDGRVKSRLVKSDYPIAKIPSLAEHFIDFEKQRYDKETKMIPIIGYGGEEDDKASPEEAESPLVGKHSIHLLRFISELSSIPVSHLLQLDLELYDGQAATRGGLSSEFIFAPRVDDRLCSFTALYALINISKTVNLSTYDGFQLVNLVDNEEIGSETRTGVNGQFMNAIVDKVISAKGITSPIAARSVSFANSLILSADVTHALNPNFASNYLKNHAPLPNTGLTLKMNSNMKNMTDSTGFDVMTRIANRNDLKLQTFHIKNGEPSGGTIGPMISTHTGSRTIDVGLSQLSMHSIRAMFGYKEVGIGIDTFSAFFKDWQEIYKEYES